MELQCEIYSTSYIEVRGTAGNSEKNREASKNLELNITADKNMEENLLSSIRPEQFVVIYTFVLHNLELSACL